MRFQSFRVLSPARTGVEGLRSHSRGKALRALIGVKLKELSVGGLAEHACGEGGWFSIIVDARGHWKTWSP